MISNEGPKFAVGDINSDGLDDLFLPGAKGQASSVYIQKPSGDFQIHQKFEVDSIAEDVDGLFFDADGDGDLDLYVVSGSLEFSVYNMNYLDRLYLNNGQGNFTKTTESLPMVFQSTSFAKAFDHNGDGKLDLLIGTRTIPFAYGVPADVTLLENQGNAVFVDKTMDYATQFKSLGMTRDAWIGDLDGDEVDEILIIGEWMPIKVFKKTKGKYTDVSSNFGFENTGGLWNTLHVADINADGLPDILVGNSGLNTRLRASQEKPLQLQINDFDQNGSVEQILTQYEGDSTYPLALKSTLIKQLPALRKQLLTYDAYKNKRIEDLFPPEILSRNMVLDVHTLETSLYINQGNGTFAKANLPYPIQSSPVYAIHSYKDDLGKINLLFGGNQSRNKPELGINMGSYAWHLIGTNEKDLHVIPANESGFFVRGEIRDIKNIKTSKGNRIVVGRNNDAPVVWEIVK
jgi:hypothetical protein